MFPVLSITCLQLKAERTLCYALSNLQIRIEFPLTGYRK